MLVVDCPQVPSGHQLLSERRIVAMDDDGAGTLTVVVACWCGQLHELRTGRATAGRAAAHRHEAVRPAVAAAVAC